MAQASHNYGHVCLSTIFQSTSRAHHDLQAVNMRVENIRAAATNQPFRTDTGRTLGYRSMLPFRTETGLGMSEGLALADGGS